ncbi:MAG TPA: FAD-binding oxidoreductase [Dehalococcoidia bacterium]|nr:FAD-binding oxidoreductase [Dehalococcoidia bacterium]
MTASRDSAAIERLRASHRGPVLAPAEPGYEEARKVWNGMIDRRPGIIAQATGVADVVAAVNFAREQGLNVAVRGGGHSAAGNGVCDDNLVVDLRHMKGIHVDPATRRARVQGGVTLGEMDRETQVHGLAVPAGTNSTTGVAGLTLGGGLGWLMGSYGLTIDNLLSCEVVTADGRVLTASHAENPDLFWALRGGGGNFGVVTSFEFQAHRVGPMLVGGIIVHPVSEARQVFSFWNDFRATCPDELTLFAVIAGAPDGSGNIISALAGAYSGSIEEGEKAVRPLKEFGQPLMDAMGPLPFVALQSMLDEGFQPGMLVYWKAEFLRELTPAAIDAIVEIGEKMPSPLSAVVLEDMHGAVRRVAPDATAYGQRDATTNMAVISAWTDPAESDKNIAWAREVMKVAEPYKTGGTYMNYFGVDDQGEERVRQALGANYDRLREVKRRYDPTNMFRFNQNIAP